MASEMQYEITAKQAETAFKGMVTLLTSAYGTFDTLYEDKPVAVKLFMEKVNVLKTFVDQLTLDICSPNTTLENLVSAQEKLVRCSSVLEDVRKKYLNPENEDCTKIISVLCRSGTNIALRTALTRMISMKFVANEGRKRTPHIKSLTEQLNVLRRLFFNLEQETTKKIDKITKDVGNPEVEDKKDEETPTFGGALKAEYPALFQSAAQFTAVTGKMAAQFTDMLTAAEYVVQQEEDPRHATHLQRIADLEEKIRRAEQEEREPAEKAKWEAVANQDAALFPLYRERARLERGIEYGNKVHTHKIEDATRAVDCGIAASAYHAARDALRENPNDPELQGAFKTAMDEYQRIKVVESVVTQKVPTDRIKGANSMLPYTDAVLAKGLDTNRRTFGLEKQNVELGLEISRVEKNYVQIVSDATQKLNCILLDIESLKDTLEDRKDGRKYYDTATEESVRAIRGLVRAANMLSDTASKALKTKGITGEQCLQKISENTALLAQLETEEFSNEDKVRMSEMGSYRSEIVAGKKLYGLVQAVEQIQQITQRLPYTTNKLIGALYSGDHMGIADAMKALIQEATMLIECVNPEENKAVIQEKIDTFTQTVKANADLFMAVTRAARPKRAVKASVASAVESKADAEVGANLADLEADARSKLLAKSAQSDEELRLLEAVEQSRRELESKSANFANLITAASSVQGEADVPAPASPSPLASNSFLEEERRSRSNSNSDSVNAAAVEVVDVFQARKNKEPAEPDQESADALTEIARANGALW